MRKNKNFKKLMIFAIAALMCLTGITLVANAAYVQIGTSATTYSYYVPFYGFYNYGWSEELILSSEIGGALQITGLAYQMYNALTTPYTVLNQRVYIAQTTLSTLTSTKLDKNTMTLVYSGSWTTSGAALSWQKLDLQTAFNYDGTSNLVILWENWDGSYASGYPYWTYTTTSPNYRTVYYYSDSYNPDTSPTGTTTYYRSNIRLIYPSQHDVATTSIVSPTKYEGYGSSPVNVKVKNLALNTDTFTTNVKIYYTPVIILQQGFESTEGVTLPYAPTGWLIQDVNLDGYVSGTYAYNMWGTYSSSTYAHSGVNTMRYEYGAIVGNDWFISPGCTLNGGVTYTLSWWDRGQSSSYNEALSVWVGNAQTYTALTTNLYSTTTMTWTTMTQHSVTYTPSSTGIYYFGWKESSPANYYYVYVDDIALTIPPASTSPIYDQTVTVTSLQPGYETIATLPSWSITTSGIYQVVAKTTLATDQDTTNDQIIQYTQVGNVDNAAVSIEVPAPLMGPFPFTPKATIKNNGDIEFNGATFGYLPVHAFVPNPTGGSQPIYSEGFEGSTSIYQYPEVTSCVSEDNGKDLKIGDLTLLGETTSVRWPEDEPGLGSPGQWTILNSNNDGVIWHPTTYRASEGTQSMYMGNEVTKLYPTTPYGYDWMIGPQFYVGAAGGTFSFDIYNDVYGRPYDYVAFGASANGVTFYMYAYNGYWAQWMHGSGIPIPAAAVDANGMTRLAFRFLSSSGYQYEGVYIDNLEAQSSALLYDQTLYVDHLGAGVQTQLAFPAFTPDTNYHDYTFNVCCQHPEDITPTNDCISVAFNNNAPVWNDRTGWGYASIQAAIDDPNTIDGDTLEAHGNFYENLVINKDLTVRGPTPADCDSAEAYLFGTVDIVADGVTFENFYVHPLTLFTADQAAISIYSNNVIVRHNGVEIMGETSGTIKGIYAYATPSEYKQNIEISDNCVHDVYNTLGCTTGGGGGEIFNEGFEGGVMPAGWSQVSYPGNTGYWEIQNYGGIIYYEPPGTGTYFAVATSDDHASDVFDVGLFTPSIDFTGYTNVQLSVAQAYNMIVSGEFGAINTYSNGVFEEQLWYSTVDWTGTLVLPFDPSTYADPSDVQIEFRYCTGGDTYMWMYAIDDVILTGESSGGGGGYGGADGIMVQGATWNVDVVNNTVYDIMSPGWSNGIEVTPTAMDPELAHFYAYLNFAEDFTGIATGAIPTGWTRTDTHWGAIASANAGGVSPEMRFYYSPSVTGDLYLTTPEIDTSAFTTLTLSYRHMVNHYTTPYTLKLVTIAGGTEYTVATWSPTASIPAALLTYTLTAAQGVGASDFQIAWVFSGYTWNINYWYIDNVVLSGSYDYWATVNPWPLNVNIEGNILKRISVGPSYTCDNPPVYPGIMLNINYANLPSNGPTPADASQVIAHHNWFDMDCYVPCIAILNTDLEHCLDATDNYYSQPDGPGSYDPLGGTAMAVDCMNGEVADGLGSQIMVYGPVHFNPYLGLNAEHNIVSPYYAEVGETINFDGSASWADDFSGQYTPIYYWNFDDGFYSMQESIAHTYNSPGTYNGYLRVHMLGIPELGIPPLYEWDYFTVIVGGAGSPLAANAGGGSLGQYVASIGEGITLSGIASGGTAPYTYQWSLGDGRTVDGRTPIVEYKVAGTYTVTLSVTDANYDTASDTATVTVLAPDQLNVIINAPANANKGLPLKFTSTVTGGETPYAYEWNFGDQTPINIAANPVHIFENIGVYTVTVTVTDHVGTVKTATKTITIETGESTSAEIKEVKGGFRVTATIAAGSNDCPWTIHVDGNFVLSGGDASGTIDVNTQETVKLPLTFAFGNVDIIVTAGTIQKQYTAFALGPLFLNVHEA